jgi:cytochrome c-type biogenesis protein CcmE
MRIKFTYLVIIALLALSAFLAYDAFNSYINPYLTVSQVLENSEAYLNKEIQIIGTVVNGSTRIGADGTLFFNLSDGEITIKVVFRGEPPQYFREGEKVVVIGKIVSSKTIIGSKMLVKCPTKYEEEETSRASLFMDPLFLSSLIIGFVAITYFVISTVLKKK